MKPHFFSDMKDGVLFSGNFGQDRIMKKEIEIKWLKKELKSLFRSMDYISDNYLNKEGIFFSLT